VIAGLACTKLNLYYSLDSIGSLQVLVTACVNRDPAIVQALTALAGALSPLAAIFTFVWLNGNTVQQAAGRSTSGWHAHVEAAAQRCSMPD